MKIDFEQFKLQFRSIPLGLRINNLGCVRYSKKNNWNGQIDNYRGFAVFKNVEYGIRVMTIILMNYIYKKRLFDIKSIIAIYSPANDGNCPDTYVNYVCKQIGFDVLPSKIVELREVLPLLIYHMTCVENGREYKYLSLNVKGFTEYFFECVQKYIDEYLNNVVFPVHGNKETI